MIKLNKFCIGASIFASANVMAQSQLGSNGAAVTSAGTQAATGVGAQATGGALTTQASNMQSSCGTPCALQIAQLVAMAAQAFMQASANSATAAQNSGVAGVTDAGGTSTTAGTANTLAQVKQFNQQAAKLAAADGATYNPATGTTTLANGTAIGPDNAMDAASMASAGSSPADFAKVMGLIKDAVKVGQTAASKASVASDSSFSGGGGGGGAGTSGGTTGGITTTGGARTPAAEAKPSMAGMAKNFMGDSVGVSGDNIFLMMTRRYQLKSKDEGFLSPDSGAKIPATAAKTTF